MGTKAVIAVVVVAVALAVGAVAGAAWLLAPDDAVEVTVQDNATSSSGEDATPDTTPVDDTAGARVSIPVAQLDATYDACAKAAGFDPGGVQVLLGDAGTPVWVKTGRDVPATIHGPCFTKVGGDDQGQSSHGNPAP